MTTLSPHERDVPAASKTSSSPRVPAPRPEQGAHAERGDDRGFTLRVSQPAAGVVALHAGGTLDAGSAARFADPVRQWMSFTADSVVLDLSGVCFLDTAGAVALLEAAVRARTHRKQLWVISSPAVDRVLSLIGAEDQFIYAAGLDEALAGTE